MTSASQPKKRLSRAGLELIKSFEGLRRRAARLPGGRFVVGYGHIRSAREGVEVTPEDAEALLRYDLLPIEAAINDWAMAPLTQNQFDALVSFAFNIGLSTFRRSDVLRRINEGDLLRAAAGMDTWRRVDLDGEPVIVDALVRRRAVEKALFLTPPQGQVPAPTGVLKPQVDTTAYTSVLLRRPEEVDTPLDGDTAVAVRPEPELDVQLLGPEDDLPPADAPSDDQWDVADEEDLVEAAGLGAEDEPADESATDEDVLEESAEKDAAADEVAEDDTIEEDAVEEDASAEGVSAEYAAEQDAADLGDQLALEQGDAAEDLAAEDEISEDEVFTPDLDVEPGFEPEGETEGEMEFVAEPESAGFNGAGTFAPDEDEEEDEVVSAAQAAAAAVAARLSAILAQDLSHDDEDEDEPSADLSSLTIDPQPEGADGDFLQAPPSPAEDGDTTLPETDEDALSAFAAETPETEVAFEAEAGDFDLEPLAEEAALPITVEPDEQADFDSAYVDDPELEGSQPVAAPAGEHWDERSGAQPTQGDPAALAQPLEENDRAGLLIFLGLAGLAFVIGSLVSFARTPVPGADADGSGWTFILGAVGVLCICGALWFALGDGAPSEDDAAEG